MPQTRIQGKFYPLKSEEWLDSIGQLTHSELKILYYVRSIDPYNNGINITPAQIAKDLSTEKQKMHRSTVGRALKSLDKKGFINMELIQVQIKVNPKGFLAEPEPELETHRADGGQPELRREASPLGNSGFRAAKNDVVATQPCCDHATQSALTQHRVQPHNTECAYATQSAPTQQPKIETHSQQGLENSKILKTYIDFKRSLSESERENFLNFVKEKTNNLEKPINDLEAWLASKNAAKQNRWEIYYSNYQKEKISQSIKTTKQNKGSENYSPSKIESAIAEFKNRHRKKEQEQLKEVVDEPENVDREEIQRQQAEINKLLENSFKPEERKSLAQQRREQIAEIQRQQEESRRASKEAADKRAEQQSLDIDGYRNRIQRQLEEFNRLHNIGNNPEIDEEGLEDE